MIEIKNINGDVIYTHQDVSLKEANLTGANLKGANLLYADLTDTDLTGATLTGANIDGPMIIEMMNARLIAAAPELLKWLKKMLADVDAGNCETPETSRWQEAHAVIAKIDIPT